MSIRHLNHLFAPRSVALIGASDRPGSVGATVLRNLHAGGFHGRVYAVNPKHAMLQGQPCHASVARLPEVPELAVICTPPATVPGLIAELGERGTRAAVVLTAGLSAPEAAHGSLRQAMLDAARPHMLRILGPNCVGLLVPGLGLNASFAHTSAAPGRIAFVSQSGALVTAVLDWARARGIGFSHFISLGDSSDVDFGDVLDYLATDPTTDAILLYMEDVRHARKFMSAARAAARTKPTLVLKSGRVAEGAKAAASHTGALAGSDQVYDAAIRRAGMLRVRTTEDLFAAVETLARARPLDGARLAIMTNGGGPGVMATDALIEAGGTLATLDAGTLATLDAGLPATWSHANPVDLIGDAPPARYTLALQALLRDEGNDAVLFLHAPTAIVDSAQIARALVPLVRSAPRNVLSCWLGGEAVAEARRLFAEAGLPVYDTPEDAINGFMQIVRYRRNQELLMQVPPALRGAAEVRKADARAVIADALRAGRTLLAAEEVNAVLAAYGVPVVPSRVACDAAQAVRAATELGYPVAVKIMSPDVTHKSDVGGVALDLETPEAVAAACLRMSRRLAEARPGARLDGWFVQAMAHRPLAQELIVGAATDPVFGPVLLFGQGGVAVEVLSDRAIGLPPLNMTLAADMVAQTRVAKLLAGYRGRPPVDRDAVLGTLVRVARLVADLPEVRELDINPLLADSAGVLALDARMRVAPAGTGGFARLAIRPYPDELEETIAWNGTPLTLRPIRPEDGPAHVRFFAALTEEDIRYRMFVRIRALSPAQLARFTQIDYDREMAFIATRAGADGQPETLGVARAVADPDNQRAEFAVTVRSDLKGRGLGHILMVKLIDYFRARGTAELVGDALARNTRVLRLVRRLGFETRPAGDGETIKLRLPLR